MSDNILKLIPVYPEFVPESIAIDDVINLLNVYFPMADEIICVSTENIRFIDPGSNLTSIFCPICGKSISISWWQEAMNNAYQTGFEYLVVTTPCCNSITSLNELGYDSGAGFARFSLEIRNANTDIDTIQLKSLEHIFNLQFKKVIAHY